MKELLNQEFLDKMSEAAEKHVQEQEGAAQPEAPVEATTEEINPAEETTETPTETVLETNEVETETQESTDTLTDEENLSTRTFTFGEEQETVESVEDYKTVIKNLKEELEKSKTNASEVFANDEIRVANEFVRNGGNIQDFFRAQGIDTNVDYGSDESMLGLLKTKLTTLDGFSEQEAQRYIAKNFEALLDKDGSDEEDIIDARIDLKAAAKQAQPKLEEFKSKATYSKPDPEAIKKQQAAIDKWKSETTVKLNSIKEFPFELSDSPDDAIKINMDKESYKYISSLLLQPENLQSYWVDKYEKDGVTDVESFSRDRFIELHAEQLIKTAYAQGVSAGQKKIVQSELRQENPDGTKKRNTAPSESQAWQGELINVANQVLRR